MKSLKYCILLFILVLGNKPTFAQVQTHTKMNLKELHLEAKGVQTNRMFTANEGQVVSLQILKDNQLKEHITPVPALLVCVNGEVVFQDEKGVSLTLHSGDYVKIEPNVKHKVDAKLDSNLLIIK